MYRYEVIVGNIGTVYRGNNHKKAVAIYREYAEQSRIGYGRAAGETVTLFSGGEPLLEHEGEYRDE